MLFYSRENGREGEKDYLDTNEFKDVYFEKESFDCLSENADKVVISYKLDFNETEEKILFVAETTLGSEKVEKTFVVEEPYLLVEQGAEAYYNEVMLDDIELIKSAKSQLVEEIRTEAISRGMIMVNVEMDVMGLLVNGNNTIATIDDIVIHDRTRVSAKRYYCILDLPTITSGELTIHVSDKTAYVGTVDKIEVNDGIANITFSNVEIIQRDSIDYVKSSALTTREAYDENRVQFISVESSSEQEFDEFDDLF